uniref:Uncharacterized protein n=1 Tax=Romanomermis culicivorax TaxID=13658 RepID=A0A915HI24_ROMCU
MKGASAKKEDLKKKSITDNVVLFDLTIPSCVRTHSMSYTQDMLWAALLRRENLCSVNRNKKLRHRCIDHLRTDEV